MQVYGSLFLIYAAVTHMQFFELFNITVNNYSLFYPDFKTYLQ